MGGIAATALAATMREAASAAPETVPPVRPGGPVVAPVTPKPQVRPGGQNGDLPSALIPSIPPTLPVTVPVATATPVPTATPVLPVLPARTVQVPTVATGYITPQASPRPTSATDTRTRVAFYGDSISDVDYYGAPYGRYANRVAAHFGWERVGTGGGVLSPHRAAIVNTPMQGSSYYTPYSGGLKDVVTRLVVHQPNIVVIYLGTNDYLYSDSSHNSQTFMTAYSQCIAQIRRYLPAASLYMIGIANIAATGRKPLAGDYDTDACRALAQGINASIQTLAAQETIPFISIWDYQFPPDDPDPIHFTTEGATQWLADRVIAGLAAAPPRPTATPPQARASQPSQR